MISARTGGRRWIKVSGQWKLNLQCKSCGERKIVYTDIEGKVKEVGSRPVGRPK